MPKQKSNSAAKKRFSVKKSGVIKRSQQGRRHILAKKKTSVKRSLRKSAYVSKAQSKTIKQMVQG